MKVVPVTVGPVKVSGVPFLDSCASTISKTISESVIAEFSIILQVKVTSDPIISTELVPANVT